MNIFKGVFQNKFFLLIFTISVVGQIIIVNYGGTAFQTVGLSKNLWIMCVLIGLASIPIGAVIRLIPDTLLVSHKQNARLYYKEDDNESKLPNSYELTTSKKEQQSNQSNLNIKEDHRQYQGDVSWSRIV